MKYLIFSDIHSNLEAFRKLLSIVKTKNIDKFIFLGDLVGYGPNPNEVINLFRELKNVYYIRGNHDKVVADLESSSLFNPVAAFSAEWSKAQVSEENQKGRHTTTAAQLLPLSFGGYVVDTPGIRQFQLWDVIPEEVAGFFRDLRPYASLCRFPNCTHTHEAGCAVKDAVADGKLDARRYESFCYLCEGDGA